MTVFAVNATASSIVLSPFLQRLRMTSAIVRTWYLVICGAFSSQVYGQYEVDADKPVWLRALLDVRLARAGPAPSWTERGPGKTRYGGSVTDGFQRTTRLALSQLAIEVGAMLPWDVRAQAQINVEPDIADSYRPWLIEALVRREWGGADRGWGLQAGVMNTPFSLENVGPAWSTDFTISGAALSSWLWEDSSLAGAEGEWWGTIRPGVKLGALVGAGYGGDQMGRLLALRGWVIGDTLGGINGDLALPARQERTDIFNERDHRPGFYSWLTLGDEHDLASLKYGFVDNRGDESHPGVWHTHFSTVGLVLHPHPRIDLLTQYLDGTARVHAPPNSSSMSAFYVLLSPHYGRQRLSIRYDVFRVHDLDGGPVSTSEHGDAITASYLVQIGLRHRVAFEHIWMNSRRLANPRLNPTPDGWQISYRFRY
jgi:hypothetical protein